MNERNKWGFPIIIPQASHDGTIVPPSSHNHPTELEMARELDKKAGRKVVPQEPKPWFQDIWEKSMGHISWPL